MMSDSRSFFTLLRYSVGTSDEVPADISEQEWYDIYETAQQQSLLGVLFYGIQKNPRSKLPRDLLLKWYAVSEQIRAMNGRSNKVAVKVSAFFQKEGFRTCILKGQGNTLNYPDPYIRMSGDIDIWLDGGKDKIMRFVKSRWSGLVVRYHHVEIPDVDGVPVEVHFVPSLMHAPWLNNRWQRWCAEHASAQFAHQVSLPDGAGEVCVPTAEFNLIYQLQHMFRHLFSEGIGLRQMMDYYYLVKNEKLKVKMGTGLDETLCYLGLRKFAGAVMYVLKEVFGLEEAQMIVPSDEREGQFLLNEILIGGNFGQYDTRLGTKQEEGKLHRFFRMTLRNMRFVQHYPAEALCEPWFRTWQFIWRLRHR